MGSELDVLLDERREPLQNGVEDASGFTRFNHAGVEGIKGTRMLPHRLGQARPAFDGVLNVRDRGRKVRVDLLLAQNVQAFHER